MDSDSKIVLIVLNYNDYCTTSMFISRIKNFNSLYKIVVVDNFSTDESYEKLKTFESKKIDVIKTTSNNGYASGNNFGAFYAIKKFNPEYIIISNPDVYFENETIEILRKYSQKVSNLGIISCKMKSSFHNSPIAWKLPSFKNCLLENFILLSKLIKKKNDYSENYFNQSICQVEVIPGSFFMVNVNAFCDIEGFDEDTFLYYEENIIAKKLNDKHYNNYIVGECTYFHNHSTSINKNIKSIKKRLNLNFDSKLLYCSKYLKIGKLKKALLKVTFKIGLFNYLIFKKIYSILKRK